MIKNLAKTIRPHLFLLVFAFAMVATLTFLGLRFMVSSSAATFQAGNIMSDAVMSDYNSMTLSEIQSWLSYNNPCNNHNYNLYLDQSNKYNWKGYYWHWSGPANSNGHFVCLSEERFGDGEVIGSGQTAAEIIYQAAQDYRINPQVLLVTLEKEQSLISDKFPNSHQYQRATGYGCPDNTGGACSAEYYGFKNQIRRAAKLYRDVLNGVGLNPYPVGYNSVKYHPNCGGSSIYIENRATSALYRYTPYQPGGDTEIGEGCASYGNLNFFNFFTNWFGDTRNVPNRFITSRYIPDGTYEILPRINEKLAVEVAGGNVNDGANIQNYTRNNTDAQKWQFIYNDDDTYTIKNPVSGKVLDVNAAEMFDQTNIQLYTSNSTCAQKWRIARNSSGYYTIISACRNYMVLDVDAASTASGTNIQLYTSNNSNAQQFRIIGQQTVEDGFYKIIASTNHDLVLDISGGVLNTINGSNIQVYTQNNTQAQEWEIKFNKQDGFYTISNAFTQKSLDVDAGNPNNNVNVQAWKSNSTCAQKWFITEQNDKYSIFSACSGKALDISNASTKKGANVQQYAYNGTNAQLWSLNKITPFSINDGTYEITSKINERLVLDISGGIRWAINGSNLQTYTSNGTDAQKWQITKNPDDTYVIKNPTTNKVVDLVAAQTYSGNNIQIWGYNDTCAQKWKAYRADNTYIEFVSACKNDKVLDVSGANNQPGTNIHLWDINHSNAQQWKLKSIND